MPKQSKTPDPTPSFIDSVSESLDHLNSRNVQIALLAALGISIASVVLMNLFGGVERFRMLIEAAGPFAPLAFILLKASTYVIAPLSGTPLKLAAGALFGFWDGALYAIAGDTLGACLNFWIARLFRVKAITKIAGKNALKRIDETTKHVGGWRALLVARIFLSSLYDFISYAAGLSSLSFKQFFLVSFLAGIPATFMTAWMGDSLVSNSIAFFVVAGLGALSIMLLIVSSKWLFENTKK